jgi:hypothetical protein
MERKTPELSTRAGQLAKKGGPMPDSHIDFPDIPESTIEKSSKATTSNAVRGPK